MRIAKCGKTNQEARNGRKQTEETGDRKGTKNCISAAPTAIARSHPHATIRIAEGPLDRMNRIN